MLTTMTPRDVDDGNHEQEPWYDPKLKGDVFLHGVTLAQHRHILMSSSPIPNSWYLAKLFPQSN
jgi:hypothetical protein